jgi:carboxymethylenebutenolidase
MERKKASDFPQELLDLLDGYVHGGISRREFLDGAQKFAVGGITAASLFQMLKPNYAWALQVPADDKRINAGTATVPSPLGNGSIKGYLVRPANASKLPSILVIHENRGLNPYIEDVARRLAVANFIAFAPDGLTSLGGYPGDDEKGLALFGQLDRAKMGEDFVAAANWLKSQPGGWPAFDAALTQAHVTHEGRIYKGANHGFHNDTTPRYDEAAAKEAWQRTLVWFDTYLRA